VRTLRQGVEQTQSLLYTGSQQQGRKKALHQLRERRKRGDLDIREPLKIKLVVPLWTQIIGKNRFFPSVIY
jgi:hypothetical protein